MRAQAGPRVFQNPPALLEQRLFFPVFLCGPVSLAKPLPCLLVPSSGDWSPSSRGLLGFGLGKDHGPTPMGM